MKKFTFALAAATTLLLASCAGSEDKKFDTAAKKICDCMSKKTADAAKEAAGDTLGFNIDMTDLNYSLCALDIVMEADPFDPKMGVAIGKVCPDLKETHKKYVSSSTK
ncbi:MAG: hypothetical protein V4638_05815 [Bacteroidota bacterium]